MPSIVMSLDIEPIPSIAKVIVKVLCTTTMERTVWHAFSLEFSNSPCAYFRLSRSSKNIPYFGNGSSTL